MPERDPAAAAAWAPSPAAAASAASQRSRDSAQRRRPISAWPSAASSRARIGVGSAPSSAERARVAVERRLVVPRVVLAEALVQPRRAHGVGGVVVRLERRPPERERARLVAAVAGRLRRA